VGRLREELCTDAPKLSRSATTFPMIPEPHTTRCLLARRIRVLRATRGWSQEVLAELCGLHRSYISGIERTRRNVSLDNKDRPRLSNPYWRIAKPRSRYSALTS